MPITEHTEHNEDLVSSWPVGGRRLFAWDAVLYGGVLTWGFAAFYIYVMQVIVPGYRSAFELFGQILSRPASSPYAYRVLVPLLIEAFSAPLSALLKPQAAFLVCYTAYTLAAIEFSALLLFRMLRLWFDIMSSNRNHDVLFNGRGSGASRYLPTMVAA